MPLHLEPRDVSADLEGFSSVLIVSCPVCLPISLAEQKNSRSIEFFKSGLRTRAVEEYIREIRNPLEQRGVRTGLLSMYLPLPTMCLWTSGQRRRLLKRAREYEAVLVIGGQSTTFTVQQALKGTGCKVVEAMHMTGMTNTTMKFRLPATLGVQKKSLVEPSQEFQKKAP